MCAVNWRWGILTISGNDDVGVAAAVHVYLASRYADIREEWGIVIATQGFVHTLFSASDFDFRKIMQTYEAELAQLSPRLVEIHARDMKDVLLQHEVTRYELDIRADDRGPGIVAEIEKRISELSVNVQEIRGRSFGPPRNGTFVGSFELEIPNGPAIRKMRKLADSMEQKKFWDVDFRPANGVKRMGSVSAEEFIRRNPAVMKANGNGFHKGIHRFGVERDGD